MVHRWAWRVGGGCPEFSTSEKVAFPTFGGGGGLVAIGGGGEAFGGAAGRRGRTNGGWGRPAVTAVRISGLVEARSEWREGTAPVRAATLLASETTRNLRDLAWVAMDVSESSTN